MKTIRLSLALLLALSWSAAPHGSSLQADTATRVDREVSAALARGQSEVTLPSLLVNHFSPKSLVELLKNSIPITGTVVASASAVHASRDAVVTYYLVQVDNNPLAKSLPPIPGTELRSLPAPLAQAIQQMDSRPYVLFSLLGGIVTVNGVKVTMMPATHGLLPRREYVLFLYRDPPSGEVTLYAGNVATLTVERPGNVVRSLAISPVPAVKSLVGRPLPDVIQLLRSAGQ